jgi:hypothetical protein
MTDFFAALFEFFGTGPISPNLGYNMKGWDCNYQVVSTNYYDVVGWVMLLTGLVGFLFFYFISDSSRFNRRGHWLLVGAVVFLILFLTAFFISYNVMNKTDFTCKDFVFDLSDCLFWGLAAGLWSLVFYIILSVCYRGLGLVYPAFLSFSKNTRNTPWRQ